MKKSLAIILLITQCLSNTAWAAGINFNNTTKPALTDEKWQGTTDIFYNLGNMGLGQDTPTAKNHIKGTTADNSAFGLKIDDSADANLFSVRNDGLINFKNYTLPIADGTSGQMISSDGAGTLAWEDINYSDVYLDPSRIIGNPTTVTSMEVFYDYTWSAGLFMGFDLTDNGNGTVNIANGEGTLRTSASPTAPIMLLEVPGATNLALTDNSVNYIYVNYNSGTPVIEAGTSVADFNCLDKCILYVASREGNEVHYIDLSGNNVDANRNVRRRDFEVGGITLGSGAKLAEVGQRYFSITAANFWLILSRVTTPIFNTSGADDFDLYYRNGSGGWTKTTGQTQIDNLYYDDGSGSPDTLRNKKYATRFIFLCLSESGTHPVVVMGQVEHDSLAEAEQEAIPAVLPPEIYGVGKLIGIVTVKKGGNNFSSILNVSDVNLQTSVAATHNNLAGLQGGIADEYYHLSTADHLDLTNFLDVVDLPNADGTADQILKTNGSCVLSWADQSGGGSVDFLSLTDTPSSYTAGSLLFTSGSAVTEDNANLFWDDTDNELGIGTSTITAKNHIKGSTSTSAAYGLKIDDSANAKNFYVRDDGQIEFKNYTLPIADGTSGQSLITNGAGDISWSTITGGGGGGDDSQEVRTYRASTQSISDSTWETIAFTNESFDVNNNFDNSTYKYTVPTDGTYMVGVQVVYDDNWPSGFSTMASNIRVNGTTNNYHYAQADGTGSAAVENSYTHIELLSLSTDDEIDFRAFQDSGASQDIQTSTKSFIYRLSASDTIDEHILETDNPHSTTFLSLGDTPSAYTAGSILFNSGSAVTEDNANFFWDDSLNYLGVGQSTPTARIHSKGTTSDATAYALKVDNSSDVSLFSLRNDGEVDFKNFSLPSTDGSNGEVLTTDGAGNVSWGLGPTSVTTYKSEMLTTQQIGNGTFYNYGFYEAPLIDANLTQAGTTVTLGSTNNPFGAHVFVVAGGAGLASGGSGAVEIEVSGTSVTESGTRTAGDSEVIVADITAMSTNTYYETTKLWIGQVTFTLKNASGSTQSTYSADFNYGFAKYENFGDRAFTITEFTVSGFSGADDSGWRVELLKHASTGWTYSGTSFIPGSSTVCDSNTDYVTENNIITGEHFGYARSGLNTSVNGTSKEGVLVRTTTTANNSVEYQNFHVGVEF